MRVKKQHLNMSLIILLTCIAILQANDSTIHKLTEINLN